MEELQQRSPYERTMGKFISTCSKCLGEGKVYGPLSKKARARRKQMQQNATNSGAATVDTAVQNPMKPCRICDGSGLIAIPPSSNSTHEKEQENRETGQSLPQVHPDISVAIVGGGIGGIALAAALQHRNVPCVVYERDTSFEERNQGYGLTMQQGARALRSLGFFSFSENDEDDRDSGPNNQEGLEAANDNASNSNARFGIHSTHHVHRPG